MVKQKLSDKQFLTVFWLSTFLGIVGADRFYLGHRTTGLFKLLTLGGLGVWSIGDVLYTLSGQRKDFNGKLLRGVRDYRSTLILSLPVGVVSTLPIMASRHLLIQFRADLVGASNGATPNFAAAMSSLALLLGIFVFIGFNIVDPAKRKRWGWASVNLLCSVFGLGFVGLYYYLFARKGKGSTAII